MYCQIDLLKDVHDSVLSNIGLIEALAIHLYYDIPCTDKRRTLENDLDVLDMFYMQSVSRTINLYVEIVHSIGFEGGQINDREEDVVEIDQLVHDDDGDGDVNGDNEYHMDDFVGFSDADKDWNENVDAENESFSTSSEYVLSEDDGLGEDDGALSDYQSGDDVIVYDFHSPYDDKEPYLNPKGEVVLEKGMIFADVNNFRAALKDYTVETGFKIVRDKNKKSRVTTHCAAD
ncbi:hypothetical protein ACSBR2_012557 [Camellia fascicularis]